MSTHRRTNGADEALVRLGFAAPRGTDTWTHPEWTAHLVDGWLELRSRAPAASEPDGAPEWAASFADPLTGAPRAGRTHVSGTRVVEVPPSLVGSPDADELADVVAWAMGAADPCATLDPGALVSPDALVFQRGPVVRQGTLTVEGNVARIGFPLLAVPGGEMSGARQRALAALLADARGRWRWLRLGVDGAGRPVAEIAVPATAVGATSGLAGMARDALVGFLAWSVSAVEFVAAGDAACLDGRLAWSEETRESVRAARA